MTEATAHEPFDFSNMPLTNEQKILAVLERIEVLLTPKPSTEDVLATFNAAKVSPTPKKGFGRK